MMIMASVCMTIRVSGQYICGNDIRIIENVLSIPIESFCVVHQSKDCVLDGPVVPLFCVASRHSSKYKYHWDNIKGNVGLYGPVLYVMKSGTYRCTVENRHNGATCRSRSIRVVDDMIVNACMIDCIDL